MSFKRLLPMVPGGVVVGATAGALALLAPAAVPATSPYVIYGTLLLAVLLGWRFHSPRVCASALILGAVLATLQATRLADSALARVLLATFVPLGLALLTLSSDQGAVLPRVRTHLALALMPLVAGASFTASDPAGALELLTADYIDPVYSSWSSLPQLALLTLFVALVMALTRALLTRRAVEAGIAAGVVAVACALAAAPASREQTLWIMAAALVLIFAIIEAAYRLAFYDELTELPGRRALTQALQALRGPYAVAIVDVDHFKLFNDQHGHDTGDQVLRMVATHLRRVQGGGTAFRSGGEEFTVVFPWLSKREASEHMEEVREAIASARFAVRKEPRPRGKNAQQQRGRGASGKLLNVTISVGIAAPTAKYNTASAVLKLADKAMYRAKSEGRNRVIA
jgi:diguanylate cyclase (GGDEF)-like protein